MSGAGRGDGERVVVAQARDVTKSFSGVPALKGVDLELRRGEIHALIGGNGSGKSTLIKILAGVQCADSGQLERPGVPSVDLAHSSPATAVRSGLHFVHQEQSTFPALSVAENLSIGRGFETSSLQRIRQRADRERARRALGRFDVDVDPAAPLGSLGPVDQTMVAVVRALQDQAEARNGILVLDEPTAALPGGEVEVLLRALRRCAAQGQSILLVTHRLDEVLAVADRVSVFRDGERVATVRRDAVDRNRLLELMIGQPAEAAAARRRPVAAGRPVLETHGLVNARVGPLDLRICAGEIVGLTGLAGCGASDALRLLFGDDAATGGDLAVDGHTPAGWSTRAAIAAGVSLIPADRPRHGIFGEASVLDNLTAATTSRYWRRGRMDRGRERREGARDAERFKVQTASLAQPISTLSGGNQQKVVVARWLRRAPRLVLLDEPTQGVDVAARRQLWTIVRQAVDDGAAALAASSDVEDLVGVCDRILIMRDGRITDELSGDRITTAAITQLLQTAD